MTMLDRDRDWGDRDRSVSLARGLALLDCAAAGLALLDSTWARRRYSCVAGFGMDRSLGAWNLSLVTATTLSLPCCSSRAAATSKSNASWRNFRAPLLLYCAAAKHVLPCCSSRAAATSKSDASWRSFRAAPLLLGFVSLDMM